MRLNAVSSKKYIRLIHNFVDWNAADNILILIIYVLISNKLLLNSMFIGIFIFITNTLTLVSRIVRTNRSTTLNTAQTFNNSRSEFSYKT